jgi:hypothetical protein
MLSGSFAIVTDIRFGMPTYSGESVSEGAWPREFVSGKAAFGDRTYSKPETSSAHSMNRRHIGKPLCATGAAAPLKVELTGR